MNKTRKTKKQQDWMSKGWVILKNTNTIGKGIFATRDLPINKFEQTLNYVGSLTDSEQIPLDMAQLCQPSFAEFVITVYNDQTGKETAYNLKNHWTGVINHTRPDDCNLLAIGKGDIVQLRSIKKNDQLFYDYGVDYWVFQLTHKPFETWNENDQLVFKKMHENTSDYRSLMEQKLYNQHPYDIINIINKFNQKNISN